MFRVSSLCFRCFCIHNSVCGTKTQPAETRKRLDQNIYDVFALLSMLIYLPNIVPCCFLIDIEHYFLIKPQFCCSMTQWSLPFIFMLNSVASSYFSWHVFILKNYSNYVLYSSFPYHFLFSIFQYIRCPSDHSVYCIYPVLYVWHGWVSISKTQSIPRYICQAYTVFALDARANPVYAWQTFSFYFRKASSSEAVPCRSTVRRTWRNFSDDPVNYFLIFYIKRTSKQLILVTFNIFIRYSERG